MNDTGDRIIIATDTGLFSFDKASKKSSYISNAIVWTIKSDNVGNIWYGSESGLLVKRRDIERPLNNIPAYALNIYRNIAIDNEGRIFAGGTHGIVLLDNNQKSTWYSLDNPNHPLSHNNVRSIVHDDQHDHVYAIMPTGISKFNNEKMVFERQMFGKYYLNETHSIVIDGEQMWAASLQGVFRIDNGSVTRHYSYEDGLSSHRAVQVVKSGSGHILVRTLDRSIYILDKTRDVFIPFTDPISGAKLTGDILLADSKGSIWISQGSLVVRTYPEGGRWYSESYSFGNMSSYEIRSMIEVNGDIWLCLPGEIKIIKPRDKRTFDLRTEYDYAGMYYDKVNNRVILGSTDRLSAITPSDISEIFHHETPSIYITGITVNEEETIPTSKIRSGRIVLPHNSNNIRISFSDFDYSPGNIRKFIFKLGEKDSQWIETKGNSIILPSLPPGNHKIFISASGSETATDPVITIKILQPWYLTWWAIAAFLLIITYFVFLATRTALLSKKLKLAREQKQRLLAEANTKMNFFTEVSHEFKTPLSLIIAPVSKLMTEASDPEHKKMLQLIHNNAMKLNSLIRFSLDYYNDKKGIDDTVTNINIEFVEFARSIFNAFKESWPERNFIFDSNPDSIDTMTDVIKMETILTNLLSNACKYTSKNGTVIMAIEQKSDTDFLSVKVSDTGIGIPDDELPYVFQRYYQSSRTKRQKNGGSGVGLAIVRKYVDLLKCDITVSSDDEGTTFCLKIPVRPESGEIVPRTQPAAKDENKPLIVIIDDNQSVCDFLTSILTPEFRCICTNDGLSGLKLCKSVIPDLIITDIVMPVMDGLEMCRKIREFQPLSTTPVIMLTAHDDRETELKSINLNVDAFIPKPFDMETILSRIRQLAERQKKVEEKARIDAISEPKLHKGLSFDEKFLLKVSDMIESHIDDPDLSVGKLSALCDFNEKQLYRKIKSLTGMTAKEYIRSIRMKKAAMLLQSGKFSVSEAMYMVGYSNLSYFAKTFAEVFGKSPREYQQSFKE